MEDVANPRRRPESFQVGAKVWLSTAHLPVHSGARKLAAKFCGPFVVEERVAAEAYRLALPAKWGQHPVFHTSQLKPLVGSAVVEAPVQLEDGAEAVEYEVERVLAKRVVRGRDQYLVKWRGYGDFENSWEPVGNLGNAQEALASFRAQDSRRGRSRAETG